MLIAYVDDAGDAQPLSAGQPILSFSCVVVSQAKLTDFTRDFLVLKRRWFGGRMATGRHVLDDVLVEIKGAELRTMVRRDRKSRRTAFMFLNGLVRLLEQHDALVMGRVWIKPLQGPIDGSAMNTFSIQWMCATFERLLADANDHGLMIIDNSTPGVNSRVAHSVFTQKFKSAGDSYPRVLEMPTFGGSDNHVGLQIADIVGSGLIAPMAGRAYCAQHVTGSHVHVRYDDLRRRFGPRLKALQFIYRDTRGRRCGGFVVSDKIRNRHSGYLFP